MPRIIDLIVNQHRAQLRGVIELGGIRKVRSLYDASRDELEERLADLKRKRKGSTFTAHHLREVLLQVNDGLRQFQPKLHESLKDDGATAANLSHRHMASAVKRLERHYSGTEPVLRVEQAAVFTKTYKGIEPSLLDRYHKLVGNYPATTIQRCRRDLAMSLVQNETVDQAVDRIAARGGLFARERWRAERIVRTEMSYAYGVANQHFMREMGEEVPGLMKRLVATFDERTGDDSKKLNGQVKPIDEPFIWKKQTKLGIEIVEYMQPPNRPNDREISVPWRVGYPEPPREPGPVRPRRS